MTDSSIRLNKHIADSGLCSRRKADTLIAAGNVRVNGKIARELGTQVNPKTDRVTVHNKPLPEQRGRSIVFYKPAGCLTTKSDDLGRKTIYSYLPEELQALDPAGRLDRNTSGVLILSNEGDFIHRITHPSFHVRKSYRVTLNKVLMSEHAFQLQDGVTLMPENKLAKVESLEIFGEIPNTYIMRLVTGYNRQIRRSLEMLGYDVTKLKRQSFGLVTVGDLKPGQWRPLRANEKKALLGQFGRPAAKKGVKKPGRPPAKPASAGPKATSTAGTGVKPGVKSGPQTGMKSGAQAPSTTSAKPGVRSGLKTGVKPAPKAGLKPGLKTTTRTGVKPSPRSGPKTGVTSGPKQDPKAGPKTGVKSGSRAGLKPGPKATTDTKPGAKSSPRPGSATGAKPGAKPGFKSGPAVRSKSASAGAAPLRAGKPGAGKKAPSSPSAAKQRPAQGQKRTQNKNRPSQR